MRSYLIARATGTVLLCGSLGAAGFIGSWSIRSSQAGSQLGRRAAVLAGTPGSRHAAARRVASCVAPAATAGDLEGYLQVAAIGVAAPVVEGEGDGVLAEAVGHDTSSVAPGDDGTSVLAAHDVTYFGKLPSLHAGDVVRYFDGCAEHVFDVVRAGVVPAGAPVADSLRPTLVLDTCWPTDALWWTPDRYLVYADEVAVVPDVSPLAGAVAQQLGGIALSVPVPPALAAEGLGLDQNTVALGTLSVGPGASARLVESPRPLQVDAAALTAYFAGLHTLAEGRRDWWQAIAPGVPEPPAGTGASVATYFDRLQVTVLAAGDRPTGAVLTATVELAGGAAPGEYRLTVQAAVRGSELVVSAWELTSP